MKTIKLAIIALLTVHGLIHTIGFAGTWGLTEFGEPSRVPTNIVTAHPDDPIVRVLGFVWLLALIGFLVAAYLLLVNGPVWRPPRPWPRSSFQRSRWPWVARRRDGCRRQRFDHRGRGRPGLEEVAA